MAASKALIEKINALPQDRVGEVEDFVDFLRQREFDRSLVRASLSASAHAFRAVWDNPDDDVYNAI